MESKMSDKEINELEKVEDRLKDPFGDERKKIERVYAAQLVELDKPICVRLDGKAFHTFTKGLKRPYDARLSEIMVETMNFLVEKSNAKLGYTQSDEISLVYFKTGSNEQPYLGGKVQKMTSILASLATAKFNQLIAEKIPEKKNVLAFFDSRVWSVPSLEEAANVFVWRQEDAIKNAVNMAASEFYSHKVLMNKNTKQKKKMLEDKGQNWDDYPEFFKSGTYAQRKTIVLPLSEEMKKFKSNENKQDVLRSRIENFNLPRLKNEVSALDILFKSVFEEKQKVALYKNTKFRV
jgi:tRNA(His) guanylyltransferase